MKRWEMLQQWARLIIWQVLSVPIFIKVLGIGLVVTMLFATVAFFQIRTGMFHTHYQVHAETALSVATSLATRIESLMASRNIASMDRDLNETMLSFPDIRYVVVQDTEGRILSHGFTFPREAPPDLLTRGGNLCATCHLPLTPTEVPRDLIEVKPNVVLPQGNIRAYERTGGLVLEVTVPVGEAPQGTVRLGVGDTFIAREIASITRSLQWSFALCLVVSLSLSIALALALVRPAHNLVQAAERLRKGDFNARAKVYSGDEIGHLSLVFNQMAEGLEGYRREVLKREADRVSLIGKIVQAQEDERRHVARELHDQLGQSLTNTLLTLESACKETAEFSPVCERVRAEIRGLIDEVRRLAWEVRPSILDDYGLDRALARYIEETSARAGFPIDYQSAGASATHRLPGRIEATLYRIAQEGITNIVRHAEATQASVVLLIRDGEARLIIEDNGKGFDMAALERGLQGGQERRPPLGLIGMKERAALVGGSFAVDSQPGKGAAVRVRIPVQQEEASQDHGN